ncbi:MAG: phage antirepressor KilAC domain-containing protein [Faecousia sp.]
MNDLQIFNNTEFGEVRAIDENGKILFCGKDVASALGYKSPKDAITAHCKGAVKRRLPTVSGEQEMSFIPESDLYRLVFGSKLPTAEKFTDWVTSEVLPSIRKHGAYMTKDTLQAAILNPDYLLQVVTALKDETDKRKALEAANSRLVVENQIMQPKADYFDELVDRNTLTNFRETAKELGVPPKKFIQFLLSHKYIYRDKRGKLLPFENKNNGLFEVKETFNDKTQWSGTQTFVTPKGRDVFHKLEIS